MTGDRDSGASRLVLVLVAAVALGLAAGLLSVVRPEFLTTPEPTPRPIVAAVGGHLDVAPEAPPGFVDALRTELTTVLRSAYELAFLPAPESDEATPTPGPRLADFFTATAAEAIRADRGVFSGPRGVEIRLGRLRFSGVATQQDGNPLSAYLEVRFLADGASVVDDDGEAREVRLGQRGHLLMTKGEDGWRIAGYDLVLNDRREADEDEPRAIARGRWFG